MIRVTKTFFPPIEEYQIQIQRVWKNKWLTNNEAVYKEFTLKLKSLLDVNFIIPMTNGMLPLQIALNAYDNEGDIISIT